MAKPDFTVAAGFKTQSAEGTYDSVLDAIAGTWAGDPDGTDQGLLLGDSESGINGSGLDLTVGRRSRDKAALAGSFTRPLSDWLAAEVRTLTYAFPFCGPRRTASTPVVDVDSQPVIGFEALLNGAGLVGAAWSAGVGWEFVFGTPQPFSALIFYFGNRLKLLDCRCSSLSIALTPGTIPIATAEIEVGSVYDPTTTGFSPVSLPTLDYGAQADESAPVVEQIGHSWQETRGFESMELAISQSVEEVPDSNAVDGITREPSGRETTITATLFADDADAVMELDQAFVTSSGALAAIGFTVGDVAGDGEIAKAFSVSIPQPELDEASPQPLGTKAANRVGLIARSDTANSELALIFR